MHHTTMWLSLAAALLACALAGVGAYWVGESKLWDERPPFRGDLCVAHGHYERTAVSSHRFEDPLLAGDVELYSAVPANTIRFDNPEAVEPRLDQQREYDVIQLPFEVHLDDFSILEQPQPARYLNVSGPAMNDEIQFAEGDSFELGESLVRVEGIRRWRGLLQDPRGYPMIAIALRESDAEWSDSVFISADSWITMEPNLGLYLGWHPNEPSAEERKAGDRPGIDSARWGAVDGDVVHWFGAFLPGTGVELEDGRIVTLVEYEEEPEEGDSPKLLVEIVEGDVARREWIEPNVPAGDEPVIFEYPAALPAAITFHTWRDGTAYAAVHREGELLEYQRLETGEHWEPEDFDMAIRLDQALSAAAPVQTEESPFSEAVLDVDGAKLTIREGQAERWNDHVIAYNEQTPPPAMAYDLRFVWPEAGRDHTATVTRDNAAQVGPWRLSKAAVDPLELDTALLQVEYHPPRQKAVTGFAAILAAVALLLGSGSWLALRRRGKRVGTAENS